MKFKKILSLVWFKKVNGIGTVLTIVNILLSVKSTIVICVVVYSWSKETSYGSLLQPNTVWFLRGHRSFDLDLK